MLIMINSWSSPSNSNFRRSNEVVPEPLDGLNQQGSDGDKDKQGDCQRAKQVPMNQGAGTWEREQLAPNKSRRLKEKVELVEMYIPD